MKKMILAFVLALAACFACAQRANPNHTSPKDEAPKSVIFVIAENPDPFIGDFVEPTLEAAREIIEAWSSLDPVCNVIPQLCIIRANDTVYTIYYSDGTTEVIYGD